MVLAASQSIPLPQVWQVLGPFPAGSRELGADPLSSFGGFENLKYSPDDRYPSELADGGYVSWQLLESNLDGSVGPVEYSNVRWGFNQDVFGWSSLQHSTYFRGKFNVQEAGAFLASFSNVVSFKIDSESFVGNMYSYSRASDHVIELQAGTHDIYISTVYDVRVFGGKIPPNLVFRGYIKPLTKRGLVDYPDDAMIPHSINDFLVSDMASVTVLNTLNDWIKVEKLECFGDDGTSLPVSIPLVYDIHLFPGQTFSIPIQFASLFIQSSTLLFKIHWNSQELSSVLETTQFNIVKRPEFGGLYKFTFQGFDGSVQYAMAKPPKYPFKRTFYPVLLAFHGAGVEAELDFWTEATSQQDLAWTLYPTGRSQWGFDWHGPSLSNVKSSLQALKELPGVPLLEKPGYSVDATRLIYSGHSNGGQGAWWFLSHYPDDALAGLAAAGYIKIQFYVPYYMRIGDAFADPVLRGILEASIAENDIDMHSSNIIGIPVMARTGDRDDNVPPFHTRRLVRLVKEWDTNANCTLSEIKGQGHWFQGVLNDDESQKFLDEFTGIDSLVSRAEFPDEFTFNCINPASTGSKGGIRILQLLVPFRLGQIKVKRVGEKWIMTSSNIRRFQFLNDERRTNINQWSIDGTEFEFRPNAGPTYLLSSKGWIRQDDLEWLSDERHPNTYGPIARVLDHPFIIVVPSETNELTDAYNRAARHLAISWYIYGRGITKIVADDQVFDGDAARFNMIVLGSPFHNKWTLRRSKEGKAKMVTFTDNGGFQIKDRTFSSNGTGILFLAPNPTRTRLSVFVAGTDENGFSKAVWSIPFRTGLMIPDYLVVGPEYGDPSTGWTSNGTATKGAGGILAAGYWDNFWEFDDRCGYLK